MKSFLQELQCISQVFVTIDQVEVFIHKLKNQYLTLEKNSI